MNIENIRSNQAPAQTVPEKPLVATLGQVLAMIGEVVAAINNSYTVAGDTTREFIKLAFEFVEKSAKSMKSAENAKAWGTIIGGGLGAALGIASLSASSRLSKIAEQKAPLIQEKVDRMRALDAPQLGRDRLVANRVDGAPQDIEMAAIRSDARPRGLNVDDGSLRVEARAHPENGRANVPTEGQKNREARALEREIDELGKQDPKLNALSTAHIAGQPGAQIATGIGQARAAPLEEESKIEQGVNTTLSGEQRAAAELLGSLFQTLSSALVLIGEALKAPVAASQS